VARKAFEVTEVLRAKVKSLAAGGVPQEDIAKIIGCAPKTLRRRFRHELSTGAAEANAAVAQCLLSAAREGNVAAQIFWTKTMGKRGKSTTKLSSEGDNTSAPPLTHLIIIPDGCDEALHDPELQAKILRCAINIMQANIVGSSASGPARQRNGNVIIALAHRRLPRHKPVQHSKVSYSHYLQPKSNAREE